MALEFRIVVPVDQAPHFFQCTVCGTNRVQPYSTRQTLERHVARSHPEYTVFYSCRYCKKELQTFRESRFHHLRCPEQTAAPKKMVTMNHTVTYREIPARKKKKKVVATENDETDVEDAAEDSDDSTEEAAFEPVFTKQLGTELACYAYNFNVEVVTTTDSVTMTSKPECFFPHTVVILETATHMDISVTNAVTSVPVEHHWEKSSYDLILHAVIGLVVDIFYTRQFHEQVSGTQNL